ncbi:MAG TPA: SMC-Scp complex subunit ScpB [Jatrophihabitantaceae bacterium]
MSSADAGGADERRGDDGAALVVDETPADNLTAAEGSTPGDEDAAAEGSTPADEDAAAETSDSDVLARPSLDDQVTLRAAIEAVLFVVESPVTVAALATALERPAVEIESALAELGSDLDGRGSGVELREVAGGVRLYTRPELAPWVEAFLMEGQRARLTQASLETLTVIAYRQPVTRARISAIRGVNVDSVVRTLTTRGLITEVGADPDTGGGLYRTTDLFLEKMGLRSLDELPSLAPLLPELDGAESDEL